MSYEKSLPRFKFLRTQIALAIVEGSKGIHVPVQTVGRLGDVPASDAGETTNGVGVVSRQVALETIVVLAAEDFAAPRRQYFKISFTVSNFLLSLGHFKVCLRFI